MKILFIVAWYYPAKVGGVARMMHNLAKELVNQGHEVTVWTTDYLNGRDEPIKKIEKSIDTIDGVKVIYHKSYFHKFQAKTKQTLSWSWFKRVSSKELDDFDVIHLFESRSISIAIIMLILRFKNKSNIFHSAYGALGKENLSMKFKIFDKFILRPFLNNNCRGFFAQTNHEIEVYKRFLDKDNFEKIKLLTLATDVKLNRQNASKYKGNLKKQFNLENDQTLFLFLGRLTKNKGIDRLIESFYISKPKENKLFLAIVGYDEGIKEDIINDISSKNLDKYCVVLDPIHGDDRFGYYNDADIYIITSTYYEETSLASVEALSVGTPVIVTPEVELPFIEGYRAGSLAKSNVKDISNNILNVKNNLREFQSNSIKLSDDIYNISSVVEKLVDFYKGGK
jgi:glycosyltransferase involved in cell wall biosynthesis